MWVSEVKVLWSFGLNWKRDPIPFWSPWIEGLVKLFPSKVHFKPVSFICSLYPPHSSKTPKSWRLYRYREEPLPLPSSTSTLSSNTTSSSILVTVAVAVAVATAGAGGTAAWFWDLVFLKPTSSHCLACSISSSLSCCCILHHLSSSSLSIYIYICIKQKEIEGEDKVKENAWL